MNNKRKKAYKTFRTMPGTAKYTIGDAYKRPWWTSLAAQTVKRLPTMRETRVQFLGWEDLLEKDMTTHSSTLAWGIPWTEGPGRLQSIGSQSWTRLKRLSKKTSLLSPGGLGHAPSLVPSEHAASPGRVGGREGE